MPRRAFLAGLPLLLGGGPVARLLATAAAAPQAVHPEPRPGVDASRVLGPGALEGYGEDVRAVFAMVRQMPHIADGLHCYCGCDGRDGNRSLLSCYERGGMARECEVCQGEARLAHRRWKEGQSLVQIRRAVDARYG
jgi:hypothetical protein